MVFMNCVHICMLYTGVRHRENMRFARTKLFGIFRDVFRAIGQNLVRMKLLEDRQVGGWVTLHILCV